MSRAAEEDLTIEKLFVRPEHVHILFSLSSSKALENIARSLKGESSYWINDNNIIPTKFKWQRGYGAFSVNASQLEKVKNYIANKKNIIELNHSMKSIIIGKTNMAFSNRLESAEADCQ